MSMNAMPQMDQREIYGNASTTVSKVVQNPRRLVVEAASELKVRVWPFSEKACTVASVLVCTWKPPTMFDMPQTPALFDFLLLPLMSRR